MNWSFKRKGCFQSNIFPLKRQLIISTFHIFLFLKKTLKSRDLLKSNVFHRCFQFRLIEAVIFLPQFISKFIGFTQWGPFQALGIRVLWRHNWAELDMVFLFQADFKTLSACENVQRFFKVESRSTELPTGR